MVREKKPEPAERKPLVELRALAPKDFVEIFGARYDLVDLDTCSLRERAVIGAQAERILEIEMKARELALKGEQISDEDQTEHIDRSEKLIRLVVPSMPAAVLAKIPPGRRGELLGAFLAWAAKRNLVMDLVDRMTSLVKSPTSPRRTAAANGSSTHR